MDPSQGFASGLVAGQEAQQSLAQGQQNLALGGIKLKEEDVALQQAEMMLKNQRKFAEYMAKLNSGGAEPGNTAGDLANQLASRLFAVSDAALKSNMPTQAAEILGKAEAVQKGHLELEAAATQRRLDGAMLMSNLVKNLDPNDPNVTDEFHSRLMIASGIMGQSIHPELTKAPFTPELKKQLLDLAETTKEQATRKLEESRLKQSETETDLAKKRENLVDAQTKLDDARRKAVEKAGGHTKGEQKQVDAIQSSLDAIDKIQTIIQANPDETLTGAAGMVHGVAESIKSTLGSKAPTPSRDMQESVLFLKGQLQTAITGSNYSSKDKMELIAAMADIQKPGMGGKVGERRLEKLKGLLQQKLKRAGIKPTDEQPIEGPKTDDSGVEVTNWSEDE